jgi:anti-anti-sigma factor
MNKYEIQNSKLICYLKGRADIVSSEVFEKELETSFGEEITSLVIDMSDIDYISSAFLRVCLKMLKKFGKENFEIVNVQPTVLKVFKIANFTELIKIS